MHAHTNCMLGAQNVLIAARMTLQAKAMVARGRNLSSAEYSNSVKAAAAMASGGGNYA